MAQALKKAYWNVVTLKIKVMNKQTQKSTKLGLKKGYYLLLMAILDLPIEQRIKKNRK